MPIHVRVGGVWKGVSKVYVKVAGVWKESAAHAKVAAAWKQAHSALTLTLSGESVSDFSFGSTSRAEFKLDANGNMYKKSGTGGSYVQIDTATDWIRPVSSAGVPYRTRYTAHSGFALDGSTSQAENVWHSTATNYFWVMVDDTPTGGVQTANFTIQIDDGTTVVASGAYTISVDREDF